MKKNINILLIFLLVFLTNCSEETTGFIGKGTITGRVVEAVSFDPIENAKITLSPTNNTVFTDVDGYFTIEEIEAGDYSVSATKENYLTTFEPATVTVDLTVNVIFEMEDDNALNRPPSAPILISPIDATEDLELSVEFTWESTDPDEDEISYSIELKNDYNNDIIKVDSISESTYVISNLKYGVKYFWQIGASDNINDEVLSTISTFKIKQFPENRYVYVEKYENNNHVIYSSSFNETDSIPENKIQLTSEELNSWRPRKNQASNLIAFLRTYNNETHLFTMSPNGSDVKKVTDAVPVTGFNFNEIDYSWSSNGDRFIYPHYDKLYIINKDGSGLKQIYKTTDGSFITECDWSNDESLIALKTNDIAGYNISIFTIDLEGNTINNVLSGVHGAAGGLNISINNKLLLYSYDISEFESPNNRQLDTHIFIHKFSDATNLDISSNKIAGTVDLDPRFSPNEAEVIFVNTSNDGISIKDIYKMDIDDSNDRTKMFSNAIMPDWE
ncbi:carboxypeptidase regulatory-like domain-containing protein [Lutibacter sp.]|uniref:carboxypeptidase regulatory-like domain-containing protein n=1 Tax=Lutibacter sp. TaxID=1925666 RepID=UPI001A1A62EE|nr:carboxypeptidase regulatory-like domain-containing protein [Lutibacter sp.]MBI9041798.1 carboxypeptidase regulatory-like domain-containing protein [Lutibacter sp.]